MSERISTDERTMGGVPCIRGTRVPVATVVGMLADGMTRDEILVDFPYLVAEDLTAALRHAAGLHNEENADTQHSSGR